MELNWCPKCQEDTVLDVGRPCAWCETPVERKPAPDDVWCADCGKGPLDRENDYRPLNLFRPVPDAPATKGGKPGGRRHRTYDLCRACAAEALRQRAHKRAASVSENGRKRYMKSTERLEPRKGGRPRLLNDDELRALHAAYEKRGLSMNDLADMLLEAGRKGTRHGLVSAMLLGWRKLELSIRSKSEYQSLAHRRRGRIPHEPIRCPARSRSTGKACRLYVKRGKRYCVSHQHLEEATYDDDPA